MRAVLALGLALLLGLAPAPLAAQADATAAQLALIDAWVDAQVAGTRRASSPSFERVDAARAELVAALRSSPLDAEAVRAEVARRLADIEARLSEVGRSCGPIPDPAPARARRDALREVAAALARGPFLAE